MKQPGADQYVYRHSNRLCVVGIASTHACLAPGISITSVEFKENRLKNHVHGKRKKGGLFLEAISALCTIRCSDDSSFNVACCIRGYLLEVNERLISTPSLLSSHPESAGFIAIINPKLSDAESIFRTLTPRAEYLSKRSLAESSDVGLLDACLDTTDEIEAPISNMGTSAAPEEDDNE
eukprot:CAMPEP_0184654604 /NCGR_PEP_ID=MMETSP0308-20130426/12272_1 /TAXON_ID=38269 /ORGANISM="Gloeochaete witrockiana, Strain SAG 46.84" /LENGTH=178 /DNA_ID=CAMNT_0027090663 /DNA_START=44 /DNA_END=580 /DNA_ORIENTATION=-